jgi:hypothetical protein
MCDVATVSKIAKAKDTGVAQPDAKTSGLIAKGMSDGRLTSNPFDQRTRNAALGSSLKTPSVPDLTQASQGISLGNTG